MSQPFDVPYFACEGCQHPYQHDEHDFCPFCGEGDTGLPEAPVLIPLIFGARKTVGELTGIVDEMGLCAVLYDARHRRFFGVQKTQEVTVRDRTTGLEVKPAGAEG